MCLLKGVVRCLPQKNKLFNIHVQRNTKFKKET